MSIVIGSFNLWDYGSNSEKKKPHRMAQIIQGAGFDVVALQEVLDEDAAHRVTEALGINWESAWAKPGFGHEAKGYAFIWNAHRVAPITPPCIYEEAAGPLTRPPFVGCFESGAFHLQLINTQISSKGHKTHNNSPVKQLEYKMLCGPIYRRVDDTGRIRFSPTFTIVLGDFNMLPAWCDECHEDPKFLDECDGRHMVCMVRELTSLKKDGSGYKSSIDHFAYDELRIPAGNATCTRVDATGDLFVYQEEVSDHVPIRMEAVFR